MSKYRKKPVIVDAVQWTGDNDEKIEEFGASDTTVFRGEVLIETLEGMMVAAKGDYIIRGVKGEFYPCKPDIFAATYDEVKSNSTTIHVDAITDIERANLGVQQAQVGLRDSQRAVREAQQRLADVHRNG